jgi:signal transduction histidine kinase
VGDVVAERRTQEWLLDASRLATMGRLVPSLIHQLSTPLAAIALRVEGLERSLAPAARPSATDKTERYLRAMGEEAQRCRDLLAALREFASGGDRDLGPVDLVLLCRGAASLLRHEALRRQVVIEDVKASVPTVQGQRHRLAQAVLALLLNAVDASPPGARVGIEASAVDGFVSVAVRDEGPGIPGAVRTRVFEASGAAQAPGPGLGLGLLACRAIAEAHGGRLELASGSGRGSRVVLSVPVAGPAPGGETADGGA